MYNKTGTIFWILGCPLFCLFSPFLVDGLVRPYLFSLSLFLLYLIITFCFYAEGGEAFSPLLWFSAMYSGYFLGGVYFSFDTIHLGKFFELSGIPSTKIDYYIIMAQLYTIVSYIMFAVGYCMDDKKQVIAPIYYDVNLQYKRAAMFVGLPFILIGFVFWLYTTYLLAGGPVDMFLNFSSFKYLLEDNPISTLPYHFYFIGSYLLFFHIITSTNKRIHKILMFLIVFIGLLIQLSKGRITASLSYASSFMVIYYFVYHNSINLRKWFIYLSGVIVAGLALLMLRVSSAYYYIGKDDPLSALSSASEMLDVFFEILIGWGNVTDIQQLVLIFNAWDIFNPIFGLSYFDWLKNAFGSQPISVGMRVLNLYFPDKVGGPTPGAIGEAYVNFSIFAPIYMLFVGFGFSRLYRYTKSSGDILTIYMYAICLVTLIFLYAKVDSSLILGFFWAALPTLVTYRIFNTIDCKAKYTQ